MWSRAGLQPEGGGAPEARIKSRRQLRGALAAAPAALEPTGTMPGASLEGLAQAGAAELEELRWELQAFGRAVEGQLEQALRQVQPLARALHDLEEEHLVLRAELARLGRRLDVLALWLGPQEPPEKDLSTLFLEAQDPCAHFEGTEEPGSPVAHPPTFSSTRQQSTVHLSRSNSFVSVSRAGPGSRRLPAWRGGGVLGEEGGTILTWISVDCGAEGAELKLEPPGQAGAEPGGRAEALWARDGSRRACESGCLERAGSVTGISCDYGLPLWEASTGQGPEPEPMVPACFALLACQPQGVLAAAGQLSQPPCGLVLRARVAGVLSPCGGPWALRCSCHTLGFAIGRGRCWPRPGLSREPGASKRVPACPTPGWAMGRGQVCGGAASVPR